MEDLKQRIPYYLSDFFDGFVGEKTLQVAVLCFVFVVSGRWFCCRFYNFVVVVVFVIFLFLALLKVLYSLNY